MESKSLRTYIRHIPNPKACCPQFGADLNTNNGLMVFGALSIALDDTNADGIALPYAVFRG